MRVSNVYLSTVKVAQAEDSQAGATRATRSDGQAGSQSAVSTHDTSAELSQLLASLRSQPEMRTELLAQVAQRLAEGAYDSDEAALKTAQAMLEAPE